MSLWGKLFGSKPKTIDDELMAAGRALGWDKSLTRLGIEEAVAIGFSKEDTLDAWRLRAQQDKIKKGKK